MGNACCSDRAVPASGQPTQLPKELNLTSLKEVQEGLAVHYREISRNRETLIYIRDESKGIERKLLSVESHYLASRDQLSSLQEKAKILITLRLMQSTLETNLTRPGFASLIQTYGRDTILKRLTVMNTEPRWEGFNSSLDEVMKDAEVISLDAILKKVIETAKGFLPGLNDVNLQLHSYGIRVGGLKMQVEGPVTTSIEKRGRVLQEIKDAHQQNLLRCIVHEVELVDSHKIPNPTQTLDQFQAAERQNLDNRQECQSLQRLLEGLQSRIQGQCEEVGRVKAATEDLIATSAKELKPVIKKRKLGSELDDDLSSLDLGDSKRAISEVSFDPETEAYYARRVSDLRSSLATENSKMAETETSLKEMRSKVEQSKTMLKVQKIKGMYFVFFRYFTILTAKGIRTWKVRVEENKRKRHWQRLKQKATQTVAETINYGRLRELQQVWDLLTEADLLREDRP